jgi:hypothetical protein
VGAAPRDDEMAGGSAELPPRRARYVKLLVGVVFAAAAAWVLPKVPHDQTIVFELGQNAASVSQLDVHWQSEADEHEGKLTLNFPAPTPERVVRQFRMTDGPYAFRITAQHRDAIRNRTEVVRRVTLDGNSLTLHLDELSP